MGESLQKVQKLLTANSHLLICDVFHKIVEGKSPMRGGHRLDYFEKAIGESKFNLVKDLDITIASLKVDGGATQNKLLMQSMKISDIPEMFLPISGISCKNTPPLLRNQAARKFGMTSL